MAAAKISELAALTSPADGDLVPVVDVSDTSMAASGTTKRASVASLVAAAGSVPRVLRIDLGGHVDHGKFWPASETFTGDLGAFLWDAWVVRLEGEYLISDGHGGAHALLWGFHDGDGTSVTGNVNSASGNVTYGGVYAPGPEEWVHLAVGWDGLDKLCVWANGLLDGVVPFPGPRRAVTWGGGGGGDLYVGGSDHSNGSYKVAFIRGFEGVFPPGVVNAPFLPERHPARVTSANVPCAFYCDYTAAGGRTLLDTSPRGYDTLRDDAGPLFHHGRIADDTAGAYAAAPYDVPLAYWELDPTCPFGRKPGESPAPTEPARTPATPPVGCLAYDSFGRANQTLAHQETPTLGSTEAGSLGVLAWQTDRVSGTASKGAFGILGGMAACLADGTVAQWVPLGTANMDVRVVRSTATHHDGEAGICFRRASAGNWLAAYFVAADFWAGHGAARGSGAIYFARVVAGVPEFVGGHTVTGDAWTTLRVTAIGTTITFYYGTGGTWTTAGTVTDSTHATGQGAGITNLAANVNTINTLARWDEFMAFPAS